MPGEDLESGESESELSDSDGDDDDDGAEDVSEDDEDHDGASSPPVHRGQELASPWRSMEATSKSVQHNFKDMVERMMRHVNSRFPFFFKRSSLGGIQRVLAKPVAFTRGRANVWRF